MEDTAARPETTAVISTFPLIRRRRILSYGTGMQHKHCRTRMLTCSKSGLPQWLVSSDVLHAESRLLGVEIRKSI